jgi:hypothetical protein
VKFTGIETIDNTEAEYKCTPKLFINSTAQNDVLGQVSYTGESSSLLTAISPRVGTVLGGDELTFTGQGFVEDKNLYKITIDGIDCPVSAATTSTVTCTTNKRPGLIPSSLEIFISGKGLVSN